MTCSTLKLYHDCIRIIFYQHFEYITKIFSNDYFYNIFSFNHRSLYLIFFPKYILVINNEYFGNIIIFQMLCINIIIQLASAYVEIRDRGFIVAKKKKPKIVG